MRTQLLMIGRSAAKGAAAAAMLCLATSFVSAADTIQDFSANFDTGSTPSRLSLHEYGDTVAGDGPSLQPAVPLGWDGGFLRLTSAVNSQLNTVGFNQVYSGGYDKLEASFDFAITNGPSGADGVAFGYLNSEIYGSDTTTPAPSISEEPNLASSFGVGFDTFNNVGLDPGTIDASEPNSISLHYAGVKVGDVDISGTAIPLLESDGTLILNAKISVVPVAGGSNVSVSVTDIASATTINPYTDYFVSGLTPYDGRIALGGRTGGANADQDIDNLQLDITPVGGAPTQVLLEEFEDSVDPPVINPPISLGGTQWQLTQLGSAPGSTLTPVPGGGENDGFLRLATQVGGQNNTIAFDKTEDVLGESIQVDFDFRIFDQGGAAGQADGMSVMIVDTNQHGDTGPLSGFSGVSEEPNLVGALGIAFDTFDNDDGTTSEEGLPVAGIPDRRANHVSLHWNGAMVQLEILDQAEFDLVSNDFNKASVTVDFVEGGGNVSLTLLDSTDGLETVVFNDLFVAGLSFTGSARAAFAARTGGAADHHDIDNVAIDWDAQVVTGQDGDTDDDGDVDLDDLNGVRNNFGALGASDGSLDGDAFPFDGTVDLDDLNGVRNNFGAVGGANAVPEPGSLALAAMTAIGLGFVARRRGRR